MWTLAQIEEAFTAFKAATPGVELEVWYCDRGLCVFKAPPPDELIPATLASLERLSWSWCENADEFGDKCWYLFRSD